MDTNTRNIIIIVIAIVIVLIGGFFLFWNTSTPPLQTTDQSQTAFNKQRILSQGTDSKANTWYLTYDEGTTMGIKKELDTSAINLETMKLYTGQTAKVEGSEVNSVVKVSNITVQNAKKDDLIWVASPLPNSAVKSPLTVTGRARGNWFFEASFPVKLLNASNQVIAQGVAQAQGEWMTTEYVPFTVTLTFTKPAAGSTGTLVLQKDNPSGLPQNANELKIPVKF